MLKISNYNCKKVPCNVNTKVVKKKASKLMKYSICTNVYLNLLFIKKYLKLQINAIYISKRNFVSFLSNLVSSISDWKYLYCTAFWVLTIKPISIQCQTTTPIVSLHSLVTQKFVTQNAMCSFFYYNFTMDVT